jgi:hypothetical protein
MKTNYLQDPHGQEDKPMASPEELALVARHENNLVTKYIPHNNELYRYYYQKLHVKDLGISTPPRLRPLNSLLGWCSAAVDVILERLKYQGLYSPNNEPQIVKLNKLYRQNEVEVVQEMATKDAEITGISFISTAPGGEGEAEVIWRAESPNEVTGDYNHRTLEMYNAFKRVSAGDKWLGTLWLPDVTIQFEKKKDSNNWIEVDRDEHNLGEIHIAPVIIDGDTQNPMGRSVITPALRGHTDSGMRILLGSEVSREYYGQPLRTVTGATKEDFIDPETGAQLSPWDLIASHFIMLPGADEDGNEAVTLNQLPASSPEVILNTLEITAKLAAKEIGVAPSYFGFETTNPSSVDAMNFADNKLLNKVYKHQPAVARAWKLAARHALRLLEGEIMENWDEVEAVFMRPESVSPAAASDRWIKLKGVGILEQELPDFIYTELGFRPVEVLQLKQWLQKNAGQQLVQQLLTQNANQLPAAPTATTTETETPAPAEEKASE